MQTYSINRGSKISFEVKQGFYLAQAAVSIKAVGFNNSYKDQDFNFQVYFKDLAGHVAQFPINLFSPYYFGTGGFRQNDMKAFNGQYNIVEVQSGISNPDNLVIQVGFTKQLA